MKTKFLLALLYIIVSFCPTTAQNFQYAKAMGGTNDDFGYSITTDADGNVYTTGVFRGTVDFDPSAAVFNLIAAGGNEIFVSKLDSSGNFLWAKKMGGSLSEYSFSITIDLNGNIYTTGAFNNTCDFDPSGATFNLTTSGGQDVFISKLDSSGNFLWAKRMGGTQNDYAYSITTDNNGNVYATGAFHSSANFGGTTLNSSVAAGTFISKLDSLGNFLWSKSFTGNGLVIAWSIATDNSGNVYTTGHFQTSADFDPNGGAFTISANGTNLDVFISKLDTLGNFLWAKRLGGDDADNSYGIKVDVSGNVLTTGNFVNSGDFDPGVGVFNLSSSPGNSNAFVSKLDTDGNFIWAKHMGGLGSEVGNSSTIDETGSIYTTGSFAATADFDPGVTTFNLTSSGAKDIFVSKLDSSGNFIWAVQMGGNADDVGYSITTDSNGSVYTTGSFSTTADFDPTVGVFNLTSVANNDIFIHKLSQGTAVNLKLFIEGYYDGLSTMKPVKFNQDGTSPLTDVETITVELHNALSPYETLHTTTAVLKTNGTATCSFSTTPIGAFYIVIKTRNAIQTWSANPQNFGAIPITYDFSTAANKAFGDNMVNLESGVFGFFSGDINQDESIDNSDAIDLTNDSNNSEFGIKATDLNGDGSVDNSDMPIYENNASNSIFSNHP